MKMEHREEGKKKPKHHEKSEAHKKDTYHHSTGKSLDRMMKDEHPVTHMGTVHCAKEDMHKKEHMKHTEHKKDHKKFAMGGVGKVRKGQD